MDGCTQFDPELGWMPAIPLPFSYRGWRTLWRWRPQCTKCEGMPIFANDQEWKEHYVLTHIAPTEDHER